MTTPRTLPTDGPADLVTFTVKANGKQIDTSYYVQRIVVSKGVNRVAGAKIVIEDGNAAKEDFEISNTDSFIPGSSIEIMAGYHTKEESIFKGIIIKHGIQILPNMSSVLILECKDEAVKLTTSRKNAYFYKMKDSEVIEEILGKYGVKGTVDPTDAKHNELVQYNASDWDFILSRAEANGKIVVSNDGKVNVLKPDTSSDPVLDLLHGATMMEFEAEMDARNQFGAVSSTSWDSAEQKMLVMDSEDPSLDRPGNIESDELAGIVGLKTLELQHAGQLSDAELKAWADATLLKSRLAKVKGRVRFQGYAPKIEPAQVVTLSGVGDRFNGPAFLSAIRHELGGGSWVTDVQFGLSTDWFSSTPDIVQTPASGLLPSVNGLQIGIVSQIEEDPDGEHRVLVKMPVIDAKEEGTWARVASIDAGDKRGVFFRPEVDDEVVLGFLNDDPRNAIILGMMNSSKKAAPLEAAADNNEKGIITRSELKLLFNDEDKSVLISTPGGNQILVNEAEETILLEDQSGNKIEMSASGILIESAADLEIKAAGDIKIEGVNIEHAASAEWKADGGAGAELSTGAIATVKGSMVQIN